MESKSFGYARVSSKDQNVDRQIESLSKYIADERDIFVDQISGKDMNRPALQSLLHVVRDGDTVYVHSLDRLGRNKEDIKSLLADFKAKGVIVRILDLPTSMVDYGEGGKAIMELINNILIEVLAYQAEAERLNIRKRQEEGIEIAKKNGVKFGRPPIPWPETWEADYADWKAGNCTATSLFEKYGWPATTFYRKVKEYEKR